MSDSNGLTSNKPTSEPTSDFPVSSKGKGKAVDEAPMADASMDEADESSEDEVEPTEEVEEDDDDNMEEIDTENIMDRQTRGKQIDWAKAAEKAKEDGEDLDEDDEDEDEDFEAPEDEAMQE